MVELGQVAAVLFVMALLGTALWLLRAKGLSAVNFFPQRKRSGALEVVDRLPLSPHHCLYLVRFRDRELLISASGNVCSVVEAPVGTVQK